jgi:tRNA(Ile)-lysidine synthase
MPPPDELVQRFRRDLAGAAEGLPERAALAVSGGPDSLALLFLAAAAMPGRVEAATVDHGLRREATEEAQAVGRVCARLGVPHRTLEVQVARSGEGVQAAARTARYAALAQWMDERKLGLLLTGHHLEDQAETLLMRLLRGSGVRGLAAMRTLAPLPGGAEGRRLCRPLLGWRRAELAAIVEAEGVEAAKDLSNDDPAYDRARLRSRLAEAKWFDAARLGRSARLLGEAEEALAWAARRLSEERVERSASGVTLVPADLPGELLRRLVLVCLAEIDPEVAPRGDELERLIERLGRGEAATLGRVRAVADRAFWRFEAAPPRRPVRPRRR